MNSKSIKTLVIASLAATLGVATPSASAHTTIRDQATEGTTSYNALVIGHGCTDAAGKKRNVVAQSVVFPTVNPIVTRSDGTTTTLGAEFSFKDSAGNAVNLDSLANVVKLVQNKDVFEKQQLKTDANGNVIGFTSTRGNLPPTNFYGIVPFRLNAITFNPNNCAKTLKIKIGVADICKLSVFPPKDGTANTWIPNTTTKFPDGNLDGSSSTPLGGAPATLTVNRSASNALPASCNGVGYDVTIWPSNEDIDANLPFKQWQ